LDLLREGRRLEGEEIYNQLRRITNDATTNREAAIRVGSLTALPRPRWAQEVRDNYKCVHKLEATDLASQAYREYLRLSKVYPENGDHLALTEEENEQLTKDFQAVMEGIGKDRHLQNISTWTSKGEDPFMVFESGDFNSNLTSSARHISSSVELDDDLATWHVLLVFDASNSLYLPSHITVYSEDQFIWIE
uniref:J domain-containing protein n=1 Tax=Schistocephalus solidus TaxID=70667 RepID=A0A183TKA3_SCHSO